MQNTNIAWADRSWNPTGGCSKVSSGCGLGENGEDVGAGCYAERIALQYGHSEYEWTNEHASENVETRPAKLEEPYDVDEPCLIFVNSMSDLFHSEIPESFIQEVFGVMRNCPHHIFQILTKRPGRAAHLPLEWPPNVWMGTSVEDDRVTERIDMLRGIDATTRFISFEPLIGSVGQVDLSGIAWAIVGGESGPRYRDMENEWAVEILEQCRKQEARFFYKQSSGLRPGQNPYLTVESADSGLLMQREIREVPEPHPAVRRAREARS